MVSGRTSRAIRPRPARLCRRRLLGVTLVEGLVAMTVVALGLTSLFVLNTRCLRLLRRTKEVTLGGQIMQERIEQLRIINGWNSTNIVSTNWLVSSSFLGTEARASYLLPPEGNGTGTPGIADYTETVVVNPVSVSNSTLTVDAGSHVTATRRRIGESVTLSAASANATQFTNASLVRVWMQFRWVPFGGGTTNSVETATLFARGQ